MSSKISCTFLFNFTFFTNFSVQDVFSSQLSAKAVSKNGVLFFGFTNNTLGCWNEHQSLDRQNIVSNCEYFSIFFFFFFFSYIFLTHFFLSDTTATLINMNFDMKNIYNVILSLLFTFSRHESCDSSHVMYSYTTVLVGIIRLHLFFSHKNLKYGV